MGRAPCCDKANVKKGPWSPEEDAKLKDYIERYGTGNNWIALPQKIGLKRCGKSCRLRWLNYLRPNIKHGGFSEEEEHIICSLYINIGSRWSTIAAQLPGRTDNDIKNYWNTRLKKKLLGKQRKEQAARNRINCLKPKEMKMNTSVNNNFNMVAETYNKNLMNNTNYSPMMPGVMPVLYQPIQEVGNAMVNNNHDSFKKLCIKLGGRFSIDGYEHQCSILDIPSTSTHPAAAGASMNTDIHDYQFLLQNNSHYDIHGVANLHMLQGVLNSNEHFPIDIDEQMRTVYTDNRTEQRLEGLSFDEHQCYYEVDMGMFNNGSTTTSRTDSAESSNTWVETGCLVYPSLVPNEYDLQQQDAGSTLPED